MIPNSWILDNLHIRSLLCLCEATDTKTGRTFLINYLSVFILQYLVKRVFININFHKRCFLFSFQISGGCKWISSINKSLLQILKCCMMISYFAQTMPRPWKFLDAYNIQFGLLSRSISISLTALLIILSRLWRKLWESLCKRAHSNR